MTASNHPWNFGFAAVAFGCLTGCASSMDIAAFDAGLPKMRPETFFAGTTRSTGVFENRAGSPTRRMHVEGHGEQRADGSFRLDQVVAIGDDAPQRRTWVMRSVDEHRYVATLSDASGPVTCEAFGDVLHIRYPMRSPVGGQMKQWLYLQPDGRTVVNEATVRVLGIVVARLSERITNEGP